MTVDTWNGFSSIAHFPNVEINGDYLVYRWQIDGRKWLRIYRGVVTKCQYVAQFRVTKTGRLTHYISDQRFSTAEKAVAFYQQQEAK